MNVKKFLYDNSPALLTGVGIAGSVTTAYFTGKATFKAAEILRRDWETSTLDRERTRREEVRLVWHLYIPAAATLAITGAALLGANKISNRRAAAIAAAYSISEKAILEYKEKVIEKIGGKKEQEIVDDISRDRVKNNPPGSEIMIVDSSDVLCYDHFSGRYFKSSMEELKKAQNDTNYQILNHVYASLSDFYCRVGLSPTVYSEEVGWTNDNQLELIFSAVMTEEDKPCIAISFRVEPTRDYYKMY